ncbi:MAG: LysR family transcriptional regulator [Gammaproteobacteria bacterium]|nr:LysR family transcriptional regulator [Gammaproteobacteria bacterium]
MDRLDAMRVFISVVDSNGFSAASRILSMPLPTVSRKIAELESHLGTQLLIRSTRKVTVTDSGRRYYQEVRQILDYIGEAERKVTGEYQLPRGRLTITAPTLFGRLHVLPIVNDFMKLHCDINIQLFLVNHVVDLLEEHIDLGIRIGTLSDSSMIAFEAGSVRQIVCASPGYLSQHDRPLSPNDLAGHQCVTFSKFGAPAEWAFKMPSRKIQRFPVPTRLTLNSIQGAVDSAVRDGGPVQLYSYQAAPHVAEGTLEIVLDGYEIESPPVNIVYPQGRLVPQKLRAFVEFAMPRLRECLALIETQCSV